MSSRGSTWKVWKAQVIIRAPKADGCSYHAGTIYVAIMEFDEELIILLLSLTKTQPTGISLFLIP